MEIEIALQEFETECKKIEGLVIMPNLNQKDLFNLIKPVIQGYLNIANKTSANDPNFLKAQNMLLNIANTKPVFKDAIRTIIPDSDEEKMDKKAILNIINGLIKEYKKAKENNTFLESIGDFESKLNDCYQLLLDNKDMFSSEQFNKLEGIMKALFEQVNKYNTVPLKYGNLNGYTMVGIVAIISIVATICVVMLGILFR